MNWQTLILTLTIVSLLSACEDNDDSIDLTEFRQDLVTCLHDARQLIFLRDDGVYLYPDDKQSATLYPEGQRVIIGYTPEESVGNHTEIELITAIQEIPYATIAYTTPTEASQLPDDPIYLTTVWCGGECINLRYRIDYKEKPHSMSMIALDNTPHDDTLDIQLRYNNHDDTPGYYRSGYASFRMTHPLPATVRVAINTSNLGGKKDYIFNIK